MCVPHHQTTPLGANSTWQATQAERILNEPHEPGEADLAHQARIEADPRWPHQGGPPIGTISEDTPLAKLARHHEAKRAAAEGETDNHTRAEEQQGTATSEDADLCVGELYRDGDGHEVWRIKEIETGKVLREGIASDRDYRWLLDVFNHGEEYAAEQQALRDAAAAGA
jgi:hypothetical protein